VFAADAAASERRFPVLEYQVEGNTLLKPVDIERAVTPFLGIRKTIKDVEGARRLLEKRYHDLGYQTVLVNIPQQEVSAGIVRLAVTEGSIGIVQVKGSKFHSLDEIRSTVAELNPGVTPDFKVVQKELGEINHSPDLKVTPVLRASSTPGQVDVDLDVQDQLPLHEMVEVNNRYSPNTSHTRLIGEISYDNLFQSNQSASIQYQVAPTKPSDAQIWSLSYVAPLGGGPILAGYAVKSDSNVAAVGNLNVIGKGSIFGLRLIEPLANSGLTFFDSMTFGFDYKDFKQDVMLQGADDASSPARYAPFSLAYSGTWLAPADPAHASAATTGGRSSTNLDLGASFVIRALGGSDANQFAVKRAGAEPSFIVLHPSVERQQLLPGNWSLIAKADGQLASGPLISNEEYGAGGVDSVRGYAESERLGDNGARLSAELRTPQLSFKRIAGLEQTYLFLFGETARVQVVEPLIGQHDEFHLNSIGIGGQFKYGGVLGYLDGARALSDGYVTRAGDYSAQFRVTYSH
jgi:hemolysin activation/secretion protein